jgi:hypothetical protein
VYVPLLASKLLKLCEQQKTAGTDATDSNNKLAVMSPLTNFRGIVVGNGVTDDVVRCCHCCLLHG